jgi:20S proteasome subunit alpha 1
VGAKETEATNLLEKKMKANPSHSYEATVQLAIATLQNVLSEEFKSNELEVGVVRVGDDTSFRVLSPEEVDTFLVAISERD